MPINIIKTLCKSYSCITSHLQQNFKNENRHSSRIQILWILKTSKNLQILQILAH